MAVHLLERLQRIPASREDVFAFFSDAANLARMTPGWLGFRILTPLPIAMQQGTTIDYRIALAGVPMRWRTLISRWEPPHVFVDEQVSGPYASWIHTHRFEPIHGGVKMTDRVRYELPLGRIGDVVHTIAVRRSLDAVFDYREKVIEETFGAWEQSQRHSPSSDGVKTSGAWS